MKHLSRLAILPLLFLFSCGSSNSKEKKDLKAMQSESTVAKQINYLSMKIDGQLWEADNNIFGVFHPNGHNKAIMIAGSKGPKNKEEQPFNINLYNASGPGVFAIKDGNTDNNVVQLANMSPQDYMYGSMMGFNMKVTVTKASGNPTIIEATFEGELTGNAGGKLKITEGKFYYHE
ncbi:MAG: hypothetical protein H7Y01_10935 [Ferruginibacter sp.]|nr:hypothetical protein [Chitinophagaceae bacterium]